MNKGKGFIPGKKYPQNLKYQKDLYIITVLLRCFFFRCCRKDIVLTNPLATNRIKMINFFLQFPGTGRVNRTL